MGKCQAASRKSTFCTDAPTKRRTLRSPGRVDCAFPSRCGVREVWANRPPGCEVPWKIAQLGKCVRATARQGAGRVAQGPVNLSLGFDLTEKRTLAPTPHGKVLFGETHKQNALFPSRYGHRMRLCVSLELQSAPFRKCAFLHLGKCQTISRKGALRVDILTKKRTLNPGRLDPETLAAA